MFEIGWTELLVIGVVALIVIGPRDLPEMFRQLGRFTGKMRGMARDFQRAMDQAANETGLKDVARDLKAAGSMKSTGLDAVKQAAAKFEKWDPLQHAARPTPPPVATPVAPVGPETQALKDAQEKRQAIVAETTERLRALSAKPVPLPVSDPAAGVSSGVEPVVVAAPDTPAKVVRKPRAKVVKADAGVLTEAKPKKPRKAGEA